MGASPPFIYLQRGAEDSLVAIDRESHDYIRNLYPGEAVAAAVRLMQPRELARHRKFFLKVELAFDSWEPPELFWRGLPVVKDIREFRYDLMRAARFATPVFALDGTFTLKPESISFARMREERFRQIDDGVSTVIQQHILTNYTRDDLEDVVAEMERLGIRERRY